MKFVIAVFKNRNETMSFYNKMRKSNVRCEIINTPKQTMVSCGISVKFIYGNLSIAKSIIQNGFQNFVNFYIYEKSRFGSSVSPI